MPVGPGRCRLLNRNTFKFSKGGLASTVARAVMKLAPDWAIHMGTQVRSASRAVKYRCCRWFCCSLLYSGVLVCWCAVTYCWPRRCSSDCAGKLPRQAHTHAGVGCWYCVQVPLEDDQIFLHVGELQYVAARQQGKSAAQAYYLPSKVRPHELAG